MGPGIRGAARGAVGGVAATSAMSGLMLASRRLGLLGEHPPRKIVKRLQLFTGRVPRRGRTDALATVAHYLFGAGAGSLYGAVRPVRASRLAGAAAGAGYGLAIWLVSYEGWLPALRLMPEPERDRPGRPPVMVLAHLVYGAVLGAVTASEPPARRRAGGAGGSGASPDAPPQGAVSSAPFTPAHDR